MTTQEEGLASKKDEVVVFVSKKEYDADTADHVKENLAILAPGRLVFHDSRDMPQGVRWKEWIQEKLAQSDILWIVLTPQSTELDWILYEVGLVTPLSSASPKPVVCFHPPESEPPGPLQDVQTVPVNHENIKDFLRKFFGESEMSGMSPPLNPEFASNEKALDDLAQRICANYESKTEPRTVSYNRRIFLVLDPNRATSEQIPTDSIVEADQATLEIFDLQEKPPNTNYWQWHQLEASMREGEGETSWICDLTDNVYRACKGRGLRPIASHLESLTSKKSYRPNIHELKSREDGRVSLEIIFVHQPAKDEETLPVIS